MTYITTTSTIDIPGHKGFVILEIRVNKVGRAQHVIPRSALRSAHRYLERGERVPSVHQLVYTAEYIEASLRVDENLSSALYWRLERGVFKMQPCTVEAVEWDPTMHTHHWPERILDEPTVVMVHERNGWRAVKAPRIYSTVLEGEWDHEAVCKIVKTKGCFAKKRDKEPVTIYTTQPVASPYDLTEDPLGIASACLEGIAVLRVPVERISTTPSLWLYDDSLVVGDDFVGPVVNAQNKAFALDAARQLTCGGIAVLTTSGYYTPAVGPVDSVFDRIVPWKGNPVTFAPPFFAADTEDGPRLFWKEDEALWLLDPQTFGRMYRVGNPAPCGVIPTTDIMNADLWATAVAQMHTTVKLLSKGPTKRGLRKDGRVVLLTSLQLAGASLSGRHLQGAVFQEADLTETNLSYSHLAGAQLARANLRGADLSGADLSGADLTGTLLKEANLTGVKFGPVGDTHPLADAVLDNTLWADPDLSFPVLRESIEGVSGRMRVHDWVLGALPAADLEAARSYGQNAAAVILTSTFGAVGTYSTVEDFRQLLREGS